MNENEQQFRNPEDGVPGFNYSSGSWELSCQAVFDKNYNLVAYFPTNSKNGNVALVMNASFMYETLYDLQEYLWSGESELALNIITETLKVIHNDV